MIVRLMGEGQYRVDNSLLDELNELDDRATAAAAAGDETALDQALEQMFELVKQNGEPLADDDLSPSDALVPPSDLTLEETKELMSDEGFIPDLPTCVRPTTPEEALDLLLAGNARFVEGKSTGHDLAARREEVADEQQPHAVVLSCSDSRVP